MDAVAAAKVRGGLEGDDYNLVIASGDGSMLSVAIGAAAPQSLLDSEECSCRCRYAGRWEISWSSSDWGAAAPIATLSMLPSPEAMTRS